jgi:mono/diheme cytochrome c family protein
MSSSVFSMCVFACPRVALACAVALLACAAGLDVRGEDKPPDFARDIKPIFSKHCFRCHGPKEEEGGQGDCAMMGNLT